MVLISFFTLNFRLESVLALMKFPIFIWLAIKSFQFECLQLLKHALISFVGFFTPNYWIRLEFTIFIFLFLEQSHFHYFK
jgi:hypothetical protein